LDKYGNGCLHFLMWKDVPSSPNDERAELVRWLLLKGAKCRMNRWGLTPLHVACVFGVTDGDDELLANTTGYPDFPFLR